MRTWNETAASILAINLLLFFNHNPSRAQQELSAPDMSQAAARSRLLEQAERVEAARFALNAASSPEAVELSHQLEAFAKEIQVAWLVRGLDDVPLPADMAARLSPQGAADRKKFVSHLEEIATLTLSEPVPTPEKTSRKNLRTPPEALEQRRDHPASQAASSVNQQKSAADVEASLNLYVHPFHTKFNPIKNDQASEIARFTREQATLIDKLDLLSQSALKYWARKNLNLSIREQERPNHELRFRQSIIDLSKRVIFSAILRPEQAEKFKRAIWIKQGPDCLLDPEMASRLGINKDQRAMIRNALDQSLEDYTALRSKVVPLIVQSDDPLVRQQNQQILEGIKQARNEIGQAVWDILTPSQTSKIKALLVERVPKTKPR